MNTNQKIELSTIKQVRQWMKENGYTRAIWVSNYKHLRGKPGFYTINTNWVDTPEAGYGVQIAL